MGIILFGANVAKCHEIGYYRKKSTEQVLYYRALLPLYKNV